VRHARHLVQFDRHARGGQALGVIEALIAQRVELGHDDERGRLAGQVRAAGRDGVLRRGIGLRPQVIPPHLCGGTRVPARRGLELNHGTRGHPVVKNRAGQQLEGEGRLVTAVPRRERGGHAAAGARSGHDERAW
jgi:hypothetical protein